jgi:hypothetical protein
MTLVKNMREVFVYEPVMEKNLFHFIDINHHLLRI